MGRRGGDAEMWNTRSRRMSQEWGIPAPHYAPHPRVPVPGRWFPISSGCKNQWCLGQWKKLQDSQASTLKGSAMDLGLMQTHSLWAPPPGQQFEGCEWHMGRNWSVWHQDKCWRTAPSWTKLQRPGSSTVPFLSPPPHRAKEWVTPYWKLHQSGSQGLLHLGDYLRFPHPTYRCAFLQQAMLLRQRFKAALPDT